MDYFYAQHTHIKDRITFISSIDYINKTIIAQLSGEAWCATVNHSVGEEGFPEPELGGGGLVVCSVQC